VLTLHVNHNSSITPTQAYFPQMENHFSVEKLSWSIIWGELFGNILERQSWRNWAKISTLRKARINRKLSYCMSPMREALTWNILDRENGRKLSPWMKQFLYITENSYFIFNILKSCHDYEVYDYEEQNNLAINALALIKIFFPL